MRKEYRILKPIWTHELVMENGEEIERRILHLPQGVKVEDLSLTDMIEAPTLEQEELVTVRSFKP